MENKVFKILVTNDGREVIKRTLVASTTFSSLQLVQALNKAWDSEINRQLGVVDDA